MTTQSETINELPPVGLFLKILAVQKALKPVPKSGALVVNGKKQYNFAQDADVLAAVKTVANENGLILLASQEHVETGFMELQTQNGTSTRRWAKARMKFSVVDAESGQREDAYFEGYAEDTGDKAVPKATTSAGKYFMLKFFGVPTGDDLEADPAVHEPTTREPAKRGYNPGARYQKSAGIDVTTLAVGDHSTPNGYKDDIKALKESANMDWVTVTRVTEMENILQSTDIHGLKIARDKLKSYLEHFKQTG